MDNKRLRLFGLPLALVALLAIAKAGGRADVAAAQMPRTVRVLLLYDMEGLNGATAPNDVIATSTTYAATRESLTAEVNAAIRGLLKGGAEQVVLTDGHGSGNPGPDYILDAMPPGARFDLRDRPYDPYVDAMGPEFGALVTIGMHSGAGRRGFLSHTYNGHTMWVMGGHEMNESMIVAASAGRFGIPLILVTGDDVLREEIRAFSPRTEYVTVKTATSREAAIPRPRGDVLIEIEAAAERALAMRQQIPAWTPELQSPTQNYFSYQLPEQAGVASQYPHAVGINNKTVRVDTGGGFVDAYLTFRALARFTGLAEPRLLITRLQSRPGGTAIVEELRGDIPLFTRGSFESTSDELVGGFTSMGRHGYR